MSTGWPSRFSFAPRARARASVCSGTCARAMCWFEFSFDPKMKISCGMGEWRVRRGAAANEKSMPSSSYTLATSARRRPATTVVKWQMTRPPTYYNGGTITLRSAGTLARSSSPFRSSVRRRSAGPAPLTTTHDSPRTDIAGDAADQAK